MLLDFLAGCIGGCAGVLVGHPLDTIKVHLQTQDPRNPAYNGIWHCMKTIIANDSVRGLYRGISSPMAGVSLVNAIVFGIYGNVQRHTEDPESLKSHFLAGGIAGLLQSVVCAPMELAKTRIQLQTETHSSMKLKGPLHCLQHIVRTEGFRGIFKGLGITALRDIPGFASYFVSYEYMMRLSSSPTAFHSLLAGGFAGTFSWLSSYPFDVIKTCIQADGMNSNPKYTGVVDCMYKGYQSEGYKFFFRGLSSTLIRAFPMNATCFFVVSWTMRMANTTRVDVVVHSAEPLATIALDGTLFSHVHHYDHKKIKNRGAYMVQSLIALDTFNECRTEDEKLPNEFFPDQCDFYIFENKNDNEHDNGRA